MKIKNIIIAIGCVLIVSVSVLIGGSMFIVQKEPDNLNDTKIETIEDKEPKEDLKAQYVDPSLQSAEKLEETYKEVLNELTETANEKDEYTGHKIYEDKNGTQYIISGYGKVAYPSDIDLNRLYKENSLNKIIISGSEVRTKQDLENVQYIIDKIKNKDTSQINTDIKLVIDEIIYSEPKDSENKFFIEEDDVLKCDLNLLCEVANLDGRYTDNDTRYTFKSCHLPGFDKELSVAVTESKEDKLFFDEKTLCTYIPAKRIGESLYINIEYLEKLFGWNINLLKNDMEDLEVLSIQTIRNAVTSIVEIQNFGEDRALEKTSALDPPNETGKRVNERNKPETYYPDLGWWVPDVPDTFYHKPDERVPIRNNPVTGQKEAYNRAFGWQETDGGGTKHIVLGG